MEPHNILVTPDVPSGQSRRLFDRLQLGPLTAYVGRGKGEAVRKALVDYVLTGRSFREVARPFPGITHSSVHRAAKILRLVRSGEETRRRQEEVEHRRRIEASIQAVQEHGTFKAAAVELGIRPETVGEHWHSEFNMFLIDRDREAGGQAGRPLGLRRTRFEEWVEDREAELARETGQGWLHLDKIKEFLKAPRDWVYRGSMTYQVESYLGIRCTFVLLDDEYRFQRANTLLLQNREAPYGGQTYVSLNQAAKLKGVTRKAIESALKRGVLTTKTFSNRTGVALDARFKAYKPRPILKARKASARS